MFLYVVREPSQSGDSVDVGDGFSLPQPPSGLISSDPDSHQQLDRLYSGLEHFEECIGYKFRDKAYLVQAFSHSSYVHNKVTDCYQRYMSLIPDSAVNWSKKLILINLRLTTFNL